jgi:hypothetical protein
MIKAIKGMPNKYVFIVHSKSHICNSIHFFSFHIKANSNPGQLWMSYSKGFSGSSPNFVSKESFHIIVIAGKRLMTVGLIGIFRPANLDISISTIN